jgi:hypothetical protein
VLPHHGAEGGYAFWPGRGGIWVILLCLPQSGAEVGDGLEGGPGVEFGGRCGGGEGGLLHFRI